MTQHITLTAKKNNRGVTRGMTSEERFWHYVHKGGPSECWNWVGYTSGMGYGRVWNGKKSPSAHRFSYELHIGPIPEGMCVCHTCDNPRCVNPNHLWLGTSADNTADKVAKGRSHRPLGELHGGAKLTEAQVLEIRACYNGRYGQLSELAREYELDKKTVHQIVNRQRWKHI